MQFQLTYDAEGNDEPGSPFFAGKLHWPKGASGVTIGHGYDFKLRKPDAVLKDLADAGIDAPWLAAACGLEGAAADTFAKDNGDRIVLTVDQMKALFEISIDEQVREVYRLCRKPDVVQAYGATNFDKLHNKIFEVLVDLKFRGDYHPASRREIQPSVVANDLAAFSDIMGDEQLWRERFRVPRDRFERRRDYLRAT